MSIASREDLLLEDEEVTEFRKDLALFYDTLDKEENKDEDYTEVEDDEVEDSEYDSDMYSKPRSPINTPGLTANSLTLFPSDESAAILNRVISD